jgi:hypothetical protein
MTKPIKLPNPSAKHDKPPNPCPPNYFRPPTVQKPAVKKPETLTLRAGLPRRLARRPQFRIPNSAFRTGPNWNMPQPQPLIPSPEPLMRTSICQIRRMPLPSPNQQPHNHLRRTPQRAKKSQLAYRRRTPYSPSLVIGAWSLVLGHWCFLDPERLRFGLVGGDSGSRFALTQPRGGAHWMAAQ